MKLHRKIRRNTLIGKTYQCRDNSFSNCVSDNPRRSDYEYKDYNLNGIGNQFNNAMASRNDAALVPLTIISDPFYMKIVRNVTSQGQIIRNGLYPFIIVQDRDENVHIVYFDENSVVQ